MQTTIEIDEALMTEAMQLSGLPTKEATVEAALRSMIQHVRHVRVQQAQALENLWGLGWVGDLDAMRDRR